MRVLVTGATGLVGTNLVKVLNAHRYMVYPTSKTLGLDLIDYKATKELIDNFKPQIVYHLAANASESRGQISPRDMTQNNLNIFLNVLTASINACVSKFIYISSVSVYGQATVPYKEDGPTIPKDVYGVDKLAAEQILKIMAKVYGFEYVIFRPHNIYGPGQKMNDPYRNVVALFMRNLIEGKPYKLFGKGKMMRAFSYVDDVVDILVKAAKDKQFINKTINVGSDKAISIKELSDLLQVITGKSVPIEMLPARPQEISMFLADHTLQNSLTDYKNTPIDEGLKKTWDWVLTQELEEIIKKEDEIVV